MLDDEPIDVIDDDEVIDVEEPDEQQEDTLVIEGEDDDESALDEKGKTILRSAREAARTSARELAELRRQREAEKATGGAPPDPGARPTFESCEFDPDRLDQAMEQWDKRRRDKEQYDRDVTAANERAASAYQNARVRTMAKAEVAGYDIEKAEQAVDQQLGPAFSALIHRYAKEPAKLFEALRRNPATLDRIAANPDQTQQVVDIIRLEERIKTTGASMRTKPPAAEAPTIARGGSPTISNADAELAKLEKEADRTGDRSKVIAFKRKMKEKAK